MSCKFSFRRINNNSTESLNIITKIMQNWQFVLIVFLAHAIIVCNGHGRLIEPPSRSSAFRYGFATPPNYNDHELYCGGFTRQQKNGGKCGECGDAWGLFETFFSLFNLICNDLRFTERTAGKLFEFINNFSSNF